MLRKISTSFVLITALLLGGCASHKVQRISPDQQTDLSGRWNDTDAKMVADEITKDLLSNKWKINFVADKGRKPVIIIGLVKNNTSEHIDEEVFIKNLEKDVINDGSIRIVQGSDFRERIREERGDQQKYASPETQKQWGKELGADFMMNGIMTSITDQYSKEKTIYYQINLELTNLETNEKVWIGEKKIKKYITN